MSSRPTYMIAAKVSDFTDSIYVNFAREHGAALMGKKIICLIIVLGIYKFCGNSNFKFLFSELLAPTFSVYIK